MFKGGLGFMVIGVCVLGSGGVVWYKLVRVLEGGSLKRCFSFLNRFSVVG